MVSGYNRPLYLLPFDHRNSYEKEVFGYREPLTAEQIATVAATKDVIYDGFKQALAGGVPREKAGILVDEEFGEKILEDARRQGYRSRRVLSSGCGRSSGPGPAGRGAEERRGGRYSARR